MNDEQRNLLIIDQYAWCDWPDVRLMVLAAFQWLSNLKIIIVLIKNWKKFFRLG